QEKWGLKNTFVMSPLEFAEFCQREGLKFDVITFFEVLEHQDRPREFLETIKSMLKPGGYIAGSVPNRESLIVKMYRRISPQTDFPPNHFLRFSKSTLISLLERTNFCDVKVETTPVKVSGLITYLQRFITGESLHRDVRKIITTHEFGGEGTNIYKSLPVWRKIIFKGLKSMRFLLLLPFALCLKFRTSGDMLYFQGKVKTA
ncbi:MAG: class I SAM-dependent methyltransferase, partial [Desulfurococcaceae archaeon]